MSTTFGIIVPSLIEEGEFETVVVAFRSNGIRFTNPIAHLLDEDTTVIALDNSQQGIQTIGDIKKAISNLI